MFETTKNERFIASLAYFIPLFGWMIPLYLKTSSDFCQFHGKLGLLFYVAGLVIAYITWLSCKVFVFMGVEFLNYAAWFAVIALGILIYILSTFRTLQGKQYHIPFLSVWASKIPL